MQKANIPKVIIWQKIKMINFLKNLRIKSSFPYNQGYYSKIFGVVVFDTWSKGELIGLHFLFGVFLAPLLLEELLMPPLHLSLDFHLGF